MFDISNLWIIFDAASALFIVINIFCFFKHKYTYCSFLVLLSIASECLALLGEYQQILNKVIINDGGFILDVVPYIGQIRTPIVFTIIFINIFLEALSFFYKSKKF